MKYIQTTIEIPTVRESTAIKMITTEQVRNDMKHTADLAQEAFHVITLNAQNEKIDAHMVSLGTVNSALVHPREVFRAAILDSACRIVLTHNHPSGDPTPSAEDVKITKRLIGAGELMGIKVLDHIIIGRQPPNASYHRQDFLSLREAGLCKFA